ncbi:DUF4292 domain-containing protein [Mucilaginibacter sp.]
MKENTLNKILIVCCLLAMFSCKARKIVAAKTSPVVAKHQSALALELNNIRSQQLTFNTFSGKARTSLNISGNQNDVTMNIRIANNKKIWVSITALLGIEVARAVITPDSILIINRLQDIYVKQPFGYIYKYTNRQINYGMVQALLTGNAIPSLLNDSAKMLAANNFVTLSGNLDDIIYRLMLDTSLKATQTSLISQEQGVSLQVNNSAFMPAGAQKLPSQIDINSVAKDKKIQVNLHYVKVDLNQPQDYPFTIPASYTPQN